MDKNRIHLKESHDDVTSLKENEQKRHIQINDMMILTIIYILLLIFSLLFLVEYSAGARWQFSIAYILRIVNLNFTNLYHLIFGMGATGGINYQLIRYAIVGLVGATLAACGVLMQGTFRNVLASPSTMGVQAGGTLGNMIYVLLFYSSTSTVISYSYDDISTMFASSTFLDRNIQQLIVLAGCLLSVLFVVGIATIAGRGKLSTSAMILSGMVLTSVINSICQLIQYYIITANPNDVRISAMRSLSMGSLDRSYSLEHLISMAIILLPCIIILAIVSEKMNVLAFGEETATTMGMNVGLYRNLIIGVSTLMSAVVIAYVGQIGFIGFMVPQITRKLYGPNLKKLFPTTVLMGAILLTVIYDVARVLGMTSSMNLFTSVIGSIVMLYTLLRTRRS
ncbi:MAG: iron ABC transporter permease [Erysipelotrichaceae bacterium]|nr:iron ABC transporter permease [Erysipelotrichaceae bacterium]